MDITIYENGFTGVYETLKCLNEKVHHRDINCLTMYMLLNPCKNCNQFIQSQDNKIQYHQKSLQ